MDVRRIAAIRRDDEARIRIGFRETALRRQEARNARAFFVAVLPWRQEDDVDRHRRIREATAPRNGERLQLGVVDVAFRMVVFALIPEQAFHGERSKRMDHRVVQHGGKALLVFPELFVLFRVDVRDLRLDFFGHVLQREHFVEILQPRHRLHAAAAPRDLDEPHRDFHLLLQFTPRQIADGGEIRDGLRIAELPGGLHVVLRRTAPCAGDLQQADGVVFR